MSSSLCKWCSAPIGRAYIDGHERNCSYNPQFALQRQAVSDPRAVGRALRKPAFPDVYEEVAQRISTTGSYEWTLPKGPSPAEKLFRLLHANGVPLDTVASIRREIIQLFAEESMAGYRLGEQAGESRNQPPTRHDMGG